MRPKLYLLSAADIAPFTEETLCQVTQIPSEFLKFNLKWGDAIQIDTDYRNQNKYFWADKFYPMFTEHIGPYYDYGVLDKEFSVINKELPLDYFNDTLYYNNHAFPWTPTLFLDQISNNASFDKKREEFITSFMWRNKKINLHSSLASLDKSMLDGLTEYGGGSFNIYDNENKRYTDVHYRYYTLIVTKDDFTIPEFLRGYIHKVYRKDSKNKEILITNYTGLKSGDTIMMDDNDVSLDGLCNEYILEKMKDTNIYSKLKSNFIDSILKSRYLHLDGDVTDSEENYNMEYY